jgi:predicted esterase
MPPAIRPMRLECAAPPGPGALRKTTMTAEILPCIELETGARPDAAVIWLHGLGADGNDFVPIVGEMRLPAALSIRFVFPHAPVRPVTLNNGMRMRAWYDIAAGDVGNRSDIAGVRASQGHLEALIARQTARGIPARRIIVAGFSQGGVIALHTGVRHAARLAGIVALLADTLRVGQSDGLDTLVYGGMAARLALLHADTAQALRLLSALQPRGTMAAFSWQFMGTLSEERLLLAQLLLAEGRHTEALEVAGVFDSSQPISYALYLPASLAVRMRAADALRRRSLASRFRERLVAMGREDLL